MRAQKHSTPITLGAASAAVLLGLVAGTAQAGKIVGATGDDGDSTGWNRDNVSVYVDGVEIPAFPTGMPASYETFESRVYEDATLTPPHAGTVLGKDWPIGEPPGIKIVTSVSNTPFGNGKPSNCIMTNSYLEEGYLDADTPIANSCDGPFQSHKRFKVDMQPITVDAVTPVPVDLVFDVEADAGVERDYQVFQKINNYTGGRLAGFEIQLIDNTDSGGVTLSLGTDPDSGLPLWDAASYEAANFSNGLWGPADGVRFLEDGFFSDTRAGFDLTVGAASIASNGAVSANYSDIDGAGALTLFGAWLPYDWAPYGIFFDDDNDPETDAKLMAFWDGADWRKGAADGFAALTVDEEAALIGSAAYSVGPIEDVVNLGLNYVVTVPDNATTGSFTLRIIPTASADPEPGYVANPPNFLDSDGVVLIGPNPVDVGGTLALRVNDGDYFTGSTVDVVVENLSTNETETVTLTAVVEGILQGTLGTSNDEVADGGDDSGLLAVAAGDVIEVTYIDLDDGAGGVDVPNTATTNVASPSNGGGGGCTIGSASGKGDWTLPALLAAMLGFGLMRRRRSQAFKA